MKSILIKLSWDDDELGQEWMNIYNLELCLYSKEHTKRELLKAEVIKLPRDTSISSIGTGEGRMP